MAWTNYHCHCDHCDGESRLLDYVEAALDRDMPALGFSSHAPLPFETPWCIGRGKGSAALARYRREIGAVRSLYRHRIDLRAGLEVDYIPGLIGPADPAFSSFDYRIGSVHFVGMTESGRPWLMDDSPEAFERGLRERFGGEIRALAECYYRLVAEMAWLERPDLVGHFDLVKKFNKGSRFFDEWEPWYRDLVGAALRAVARSGCILEVNTGGMARGWTDEPYPSPWILARCRELGLPLALSSDAHRPSDLAFGFDEAAAAVAGAGFGELMVLGAGGWLPAAFDGRGIARRPLRTAA